jgi:ankyrin repeat protein
MVAALAGQVAAVKELRHHGASYDKKDKGGSTAVHWAVDSGNLELVDWMLDDGADIGIKDDNGWTPLMRVGQCLRYSRFHQNT